MVFHVKENDKQFDQIEQKIYQILYTHTPSVSKRLHFLFFKFLLVAWWPIFVFQLRDKKENAVRLYFFCLRNGTVDQIEQKIYQNLYTHQVIKAITFLFFSFVGGQYCVSTKDKKENAV